MTSRISKQQTVGFGGFDAKLMKYALAGGALLALPGSVKASGIAYSGPLAETITYGQDLPVSFDNTTTDLELMAGEYYDCCSNYGYEEGAQTQVAPENGAELNDTLPVPAGGVIGPASSFNGGTPTLYAQYIYYARRTYTNTYYYYSSTTHRYRSYKTYHYSYVPEGSGSLGTAPDAGNPFYVGAEFQRNGQTYYGWAELSTQVTIGSAELTLLGYAYNTTPGASIEAGETALPTPEPSSLALFALGATGVLALRARRKAA